MRLTKEEREMHKLIERERNVLYSISSMYDALAHAYECFERDSEQAMYLSLLSAHMHLDDAKEARGEK